MVDKIIRLTGVVMIFALLGFYTPIFAADKEIIFENTNYEKQESIRVSLDDEEIIFDVTPQIIDGRTLVPMRAIFESLGLNVTWEAETKTAIGKNSKDTISFTVGAKEANVNGSLMGLDVPASIIDGRTMIPLRFLSESMGYNVVWVADSKLVLLSKSTVVEWRNQVASLLPPYNVTQEQYINGIKTGKTRVSKSDFAKDLEEKLKANKNVPLYIHDSGVGIGNGVPCVYIWFANYALKSVVAFEVEFDCYDDFGRPVKYLGIGSNTFSGIIPAALGAKILPGEWSSFNWTLSRLPTTTKISNIKITEVLFEDGSTWKSGKGTSQLRETQNDTSNNSYANERARQYERDLADLRSQIASAKENKNVSVYYEGQGWVWTYDRSVVSSLEKQYQNLLDSYNSFKAANNI